MDSILYIKFNNIFRFNILVWQNDFMKILIPILSLFFLSSCNIPLVPFI